MVPLAAQLGEDDRILGKSMEDNGQHGCEVDVEQQRGYTVVQLVTSKPSDFGKYKFESRSSHTNWDLKKQNMPNKWSTMSSCGTQDSTSRSTRERDG